MNVNSDTLEKFHKHVSAAVNVDRDEKDEFIDGISEIDNLL